MQGTIKQKELLNQVYKCLKKYDENLKNKQVMFIIENKDKSIIMEEAYFPKSCYQHLTGITIIEKKKR